MSYEVGGRVRVVSEHRHRGEVVALGILGVHIMFDGTMGVAALPYAEVEAEDLPCACEWCQAPQRVGEGKLKPLLLTGKLFPWGEGEPAFLRMPNSPFFYIACFESAAKLRRFMATQGFSYTKIKQIEDGREFLLGFGPEHRRMVKIVVEPRVLPNGRIRYSEVQWPES